MSDKLDDLARALQAATPAADADKKTDVLARAQENFEKSPLAAQGSAVEARQISDRPKKGLFRGVFEMLSTLSTRAALGGSTAIAVIGLIAVVNFADFGPKEPLRFGSYEGVADAGDQPLRQAEPLIRELEEVSDIATDELAAQRPAPTPLHHNATVSKQSRAVQGATSEAAPLGLIAPSPMPAAEADAETYPQADTNPLKVTAEEPVSTFSVDVDTASYSVVRNMISLGQLPHPSAVRVEEMVNYFSYGYAAPEGDQPFSVALASMETPWNSGTQLVRIGLQGELPEIDARPPLNLVFLIDTSGSMNQPNKLPLLKQSLSLMLSELRPEDEVAIVAYAGSAGEVLKPTKAAERDVILGALDRLQSGGGTAGQAGLQQAYAIAEKMTEAGEVSRVLLATDGDFNVGLSDPEALKDYITGKRESGTYLSVLGFGRGNLDDATMQALAQNGNGTAAYIDTLSEAQKVLVDQLSGALFPIADDVKIQVEWNPAQVAEYRLIGYETRALNREDFNNDRVDAGEIGAGHQVTALYEITPVGSGARLTEPLRYGATDDVDTSGELGFLRLRYKAPGDDVSQLIERPIARGLEADADLRFAAAIAGFGQIMRDVTYLGDWGWADAIDLASTNRGADAFGYRNEAVRLMRLAASLDR